MTQAPSRRDFMKTIALGATAAALPGCAALSGRSRREGPPNIVVIFTDDQGWADTGRFGAKGFETPHLDRMADDGMRFTSAYVAQPVCGASRAALLTGCYPNRIGLLGAPGPNAKHGIHDEELTIAEMLKEQGYATAIFGKWHLGHRAPFLPMRHGFDEYFGLPYSNDMWPHHPEHPESYPDLPLIEGDEIIAHNPDMNKLTTWYTERAVRFIDRHHDEPFFLYLPHSMPHVPLGVSDKFRGKSAQGMYGDVIMEIDWSVGQVLAALERHGLDEDTFVFFATDNGPWLSYGDHAGSAGPLREGKGTTWDGGDRVPCIVRWPGRIPEGVECAEPVMTIDLLPTLARIAGGRLPTHTIDGKDIWPLMSGEQGARSPHEALYFYWVNQLQAVRSGRWKLHLPHKYGTLSGRQGGTGGIPVKYDQAKTELALFDLENDIGESIDVAAEHPDLVQRLKAMAEAFDKDLKANRREHGQVSE